MKKDFLYYISLTAIIIVGFLLGSYVPLGTTIQIACIVATGFSYAFLGVLHHILHHSFSLRIMLEYIAIATLGISVALFFFTVAL